MSSKLHTPLAVNQQWDSKCSLRLQWTLNYPSSMPSTWCTDFIKFVFLIIYPLPDSDSIPIQADISIHIRLEMRPEARNIVEGLPTSPLSNGSESAHQNCVQRTSSGTQRCLPSQHQHSQTIRQAGTMQFGNSSWTVVFGSGNQAFVGELHVCFQATSQRAAKTHSIKSQPSTYIFWILQFLCCFLDNTLVCNRLNIQPYKIPGHG